MSHSRLPPRPFSSAALELCRCREVPAHGSDVYKRTTSAGTPVGLTAYTGDSIVSVIADPEDWHQLFVADDDQIFMSGNAGSTFSEITGNLTSNFNQIQIRSLEFLRYSQLEGAVLVGTNQGIYAAFQDDYTSWFKVGVELPNTQVWDLVYNRSDDVLIAGTFGRGTWKMEDAGKELFGGSVVDDDDELCIPILTSQNNATAVICL